MVSKKARLSETERFIELWHEKEKSVRRMLEKLEMTNN